MGLRNKTKKRDSAPSAPNPEGTKQPDDKPGNPKAQVDGKNDNNQVVGNPDTENQENVLAEPKTHADNGTHINAYYDQAEKALKDAEKAIHKAQEQLSEALDQIR